MLFFCLFFEIKGYFLSWNNSLFNFCFIFKIKRVDFGVFSAVKLLRVKYLYMEAQYVVMFDG